VRLLAALGTEIASRGSRARRVGPQSRGRDWRRRNGVRGVLRGWTRVVTVAVCVAYYGEVTTLVWGSDHFAMTEIKHESK